MTFTDIRHALLVLADECEGGREYAEISELLSAWEVRWRGMVRKESSCRLQRLGQEYDASPEYQRGWRDCLTEFKSSIHQLGEG